MPRPPVRKPKKKQLEWVSVPVDQNDGTLEGYMGGVDWRKAFGPMAAPRKMSKFETDAPAKPAAMTGAAGL